MTTTIIIDHPYPESFNQQLVKVLIQDLVANNKKYQLIDLNQDQFNPVMTQAELAGYATGTVKDPLIKKYVAYLKETTELVLVFPVWWYSTPASLKGFLDKILLQNFAFYDEGAGIQPLLKISSAVIFSTSEQSAESLQKRCSDSYRHQVTATLKDVGVKRITWHHLGLISSISEAQRGLFLDQAPAKLQP